MNKKVINIINESKNITIDAKNNEKVILNYFNDNAKSMSIDIKQDSNSYVVINYSCITKEDIKININGLVKGNNNNTIINLHSISENNHANINVCVKVEDGTINNNVIEDLKGINEEGTITFMPILEVDTNDVNAEHYATIGGFDENILFYLESKGLNNQKSKELLKNSFKYNLFNEDFIKMINK